MECLVGNQRVTGVGNISPTGTAIRIYAVDSHASVSSSCLTFHNGLVSATTTTVYLVTGSDTQGNIHESWGEGLLFPSGVWIDTGTAGAVTALVNYATVKA